MDNRYPSEIIAEFLQYIDECSSRYNYAYSEVNEEDKKLQDFVHDMEFAKDRAERNKIATKLQQSRRARRKQKNEAKKYELIVKFFAEQKNREVFNSMKQLLGKQRKEEEYLKSEKTYKPRGSQ